MRTPHPTLLSLGCFGLSKSFFNQKKIVFFLRLFLPRSSLKQEAAEGKVLSLSLQDGIQAEEDATPGFVRGGLCAKGLRSTHVVCSQGSCEDVVLQLVVVCKTLKGIL